MIRLRRIKVRALRILFENKKQLSEFKIELALKLNCKVGDITFTIDEDIPH